ECRAIVTDGSSVEGWVSFRTPIHTRYAAPAYFTPLNAAADVASSADSPSVAATTWTSPPVATPRHDTIPAARPWLMLRVTMYNTAGPGVTVRTTAAATNKPRLAVAIIERAHCQTRLHGRPSSQKILLHRRPESRRDRSRPARRAPETALEKWDLLIAAWARV